MPVKPTPAPKETSRPTGVQSSGIRLDGAARHELRVLLLGELARAEGLTADAIERSDEGTQAGTETLHDLRVSIRRIRSYLSVYRDEFGPGLGERNKKKLRNWVRSTNAARDAEVREVELAQVTSAWLATPELVAVQKNVAKAEDLAKWLIDTTTVELSQGYASLKSSLSELQRLLGKFRKSLRYYVEEHEVGVHTSPRTLAAAALDATQKQAEWITSHMADSIRLLPRDRQRATEGAHEARIAGKRLRYVLEPLAAELPEAKNVLKTLKRFQELLGRLNDAHVQGLWLRQLWHQLSRDHAQKMMLSQSSGPYDAVDLSTELSDSLWFTERLSLLGSLYQYQQNTEGQLLREVQGLWQAGIEDKFKAHVEELTTALRHASRIEIERRFLLRGVPDFEAHWKVNAIKIEQGYLPGDAIVERVRRVRSEGVTKHFRTLKVGKGAVRHEFEEQISTKLFRGLYALTQGARILKTRHQVADPQTPGLIWEIDVFQDRALVLAEIELGSDAPFEPPEWLKPWIISEVTEDGRFTNASLARTRQVPKVHMPKVQSTQTQV